MRTGFLLLALALTVTDSSAQSSLRVSGLLYSDYGYVVATRDGSRAGENGFGYRRLYLTVDHRTSERISVRARLEANDNATNSAGRPSPFVKDLFVRWHDGFGEGHDVYFGVTAPPGWETSERFLGYRSLEATIMDRLRIASSRDFGVRASGPLLGKVVRYNVMFANNNSVNPDGDRYKRLYGQLEWVPASGWTVTMGGDYAPQAGSETVTANAFAGWETDSFRAGVEAFLSPVREDGTGSTTDRSGASIFAAARVSHRVEAVGRYDSYSMGPDGARRSGWYGLAGLSFRAADGLAVIPNVTIDKNLTAPDPLVTARVTVHADF